MNSSRKEAIRTLHPAYFALVMATGIVSIAANLMGMSAIAQALLAINVVAFACLCVLTVIRVARFPGDVFADLIDHQRGVGFFTMVAATSVLGSQIVILLQSYRIALALWFVTLALWLFFIYAVFAAFTVKEVKPTLDQGISGAGSWPWWQRSRSRRSRR